MKTSHKKESGNYVISIMSKNKVAPRGSVLCSATFLYFLGGINMIQRQKGCNDIYGRDAKVWKYVDTVIDALMEKYNYGYIRTPIFEATELFHRGVGETTDIVTKESYDFEDKGGRKITLRPEGTAGVVRSFIENKMYGDPNQPVKVYYNGTMYRYERP